MKPELKNLDCMDKIGLNGKRTWILDPKQDTILEQNTASTVAPLCTFLKDDCLVLRCGLVI